MISVLNLKTYITLQTIRWDNVFVICSKLADNKKLNEEQEEFLTNLNLKVDEFNKKKLDKYSKDMKKGKIVKEPKLLKHFGVDNKFIPYYKIRYF